MSLDRPNPSEEAPSLPRKDVFLSLLDDVREALEPRLAAWLASRVAQARDASDDVAIAARAIEQLSVRGGKRARAALVAAAYDACSEAAECSSGAWLQAMPAMLAIELLQTYLLIHDDWMDDDAVRRGGPSVHVVLREAFGALGDPMAVLAGDLACGYAQSALLESDASPARLLAAARTLSQIQEDVVRGQMAEMCVGKTNASRVPSLETVHALKTASYTVTGPLLLGAHFAGASDAHVHALGRFGKPLGIAFQLRDDLLGTFGDPRVTGKPVGNDIRQGKRTALVEELMRDRDSNGSEKARGVLGNPRASDEQVRALVAWMDASGARSRVEARIDALLSEAKAVLADTPGLTKRGRAELDGALVVLGNRSS